MARFGEEEEQEEGKVVAREEILTQSNSAITAPRFRKRKWEKFPQNFSP